MQASLQFEGTLILQIHGDGPVQLMVSEVRSDLSFRATASLASDLPDSTWQASDKPLQLPDLVNVGQQGRCAITLDATQKFPGQQAYQGIVPLTLANGRPVATIAQALEHYMLQSEQLNAVMVLAANDDLAAGLLIQRMPTQGAGNLATRAQDEAQKAELDEHYNRIATLSASLKPEELLTLDADTILRRLYWEEQVLRFEPALSDPVPRFVCVCSRERVQRMIQNLGLPEAQSILDERGNIEVSCEFCAAQYRFDEIDTRQIFIDAVAVPPVPSQLQ
jgi:molecular chaperone Hsp33